MAHCRGNRTLILRDITERKRAERYLQFLAHHDPMTGLANRPDFTRRTTEALRRFRRTKQAGAILYLDIDGFKQVNDTLGHQCGARGYQLGGHTVHISASLGLAMITADLPDDADAAAEMALNYADQAMYRAKRNGGDQTVTSTPQTRREWTNDRGHTPNALLRLWPLQQLHNATLAGITAELLWPETHQEPTLSSVQHRDLDRSVITIALDQAQTLPATHDLLCLPIHEATVHDSTFPTWLAQTTTSRAFDPKALVFKLDSATRFKMNPTMQHTMSQLAEAGCSFQVAEFGAGYADIYTAHAAPVRGLEIASVISTTTSQHDYVRAIADFGHDLDLKIVVGNLETAHHVDRPRDTGCDLGWGPAAQPHLEDTPLAITPHREHV